MPQVENTTEVLKNEQTESQQTQSNDSALAEASTTNDSDLRESGLEELKGSTSEVAFDNEISLEESEQTQVATSELSQAELSDRAQRLMNAMHRWGTDEAAIYEALSGLSPEQSEQLQDFYQEQYDRSLESHLRAELGGADLDRAMGLLKGWTAEKRAEVLHEAMAGLGTNEDRIAVALEGISPAEAKELKETFNKMYNSDLITGWIKKDLSGTDLDKALRALDSADATSTAESLNRARLYGGPALKESVTFLAAQSEEYRQDVLNEYERITGISFFADMRNSLGAHDYINVVNTFDPEAAKAGIAYAAMQGVGTNEQGLKDLFLSLSPEELQNTETKFSKYYSEAWGAGQTLRTALRAELNNNDLADILDTLNHDRDLLAEVNSANSEPIPGTADKEEQLASDEALEPEIQAEVTQDNFKQVNPEEMTIEALNLKTDRIKNPELKELLELYVESVKNPDQIAALRDKVSSLSENQVAEFKQIALSWKPNTPAQNGFHDDFLKIINDPLNFTIDDLALNSLSNQEYAQKINSYSKPV